MYKTLRIFIVLYLFFSSVLLFARTTNNYIYRVFIANQTEMDVLKEFEIEIVGTNFGRWVDIECSENSAWLIASRGLKIQFLHSVKTKGSDVQLMQGFHNYSETREFLFQIAENYPSITRLDSIGASLENRGIWALKISDFPDADEDEPCLLIEGCIHGNENHSLEVCLYFIQYLVENYQINPEVTYWIENREIWIVPLVNPDGHEIGWRWNADHIDLNRNFGYWWGFAASRYGEAPFSEPETQAIRDLALTIKPYGSLAFHTSGRVILYPWAYTSDPVAPDDQLFVETAKELVDSINTVDPNIQYSYRRSGTWYWHGGEHNDWMYSQYGMLSFTLELMTSQEAPPSDHENEVVLPALGVMLRRPDKAGLMGVIQDAETELPVNATFKIKEIFDTDQLVPRKSEPLFGRYIRFLAPGNYTFEVTAPGYLHEIRQLQVNQSDSMKLIDFQMIKGPDIKVDHSVINDDLSGSIVVNQILNRGEAADLIVFARNIGIHQAKNVYGILSTTSGHVSIAVDSVWFGDILPDQVVESEVNFHVEISPDVLPGQKCEFKIDFYDEDMNHWEEFFFQRIQGFFDNMEIEKRDQWTHGVFPDASNTQDDWQYGVPYGESNDPFSAHSLSFVWGNDLGSGSWNGRYQNNIHNYLEMRPLNLTGWNRVYLQFYRWLNVSSGDRAYVTVNNQAVWDNLYQSVSDNNWLLQTIDISAFAANRDSIVIRFALKSDDSGTNGGWTIDDVMVHEDVLLSVESKHESTFPETFYLIESYPNPFNSVTNIRFVLTKTAPIELAIFNVLGQRVKTIVTSKLPAGTYQYRWEGKNDSEIPVGTGLYVIKLKDDRHVLSSKVLLIR